MSISKNSGAAKRSWFSKMLPFITVGGIAVLGLLVIAYSQSIAEWHAVNLPGPSKPRLTEYAISINLAYTIITLFTFVALTFTIYVQQQQIARNDEANARSERLSAFAINTRNFDSLWGASRQLMLNIGFRNALSPTQQNVNGITALNQMLHQYNKYNHDRTMPEDLARYIESSEQKGPALTEWEPWVACQFVIYTSLNKNEWATSDFHEQFKRLWIGTMIPVERRYLLALSMVDNRPVEFVNFLKAAFEEY